ncbi:YdiK family protein [Oceanobacillus jeddahense]|uniref:YdiK family protein n=1 Tax=Oceanobacillus jeddahense TaxID=1462527 RepID=A0ABY5JYU3_9BACI|nr:YdiK family protein [Oceanobacillus jeddahense]UUI04226.1 YdiK family protein [Oceanobacillus jeddahense]
MHRPYLIKAIVYILFGALLIYFGVLSKGDTVWDVVTIIFAGFAALTFYAGLRMLRFYFKVKNKK